MSIIIKGMDMPQSCRRCKFCVDMNNYPFSACFLTDEEIPFETDRLEDCPLIEIDDELYEKAVNAYVVQQVRCRNVDNH